MSDYIPRGRSLKPHSPDRNIHISSNPEVKKYNKAMQERMPVWREEVIAIAHKKFMEEKAARKYGLHSHREM